jgi:hypothetical protein
LLAKWAFKSSFTLINNNLARIDCRVKHLAHVFMAVCTETREICLLAVICHNKPMRRQCQFTVKRSEERVGLTVAAEQQPCGVQVVEWVVLRNVRQTKERLRLL